MCVCVSRYRGFAFLLSIQFIDMRLKYFKCVFRPFRLSYFFEEIYSLRSKLNHQANKMHL